MSPGIRGALLALPALVVLGAAWLSRGAALVDDAYISLSYARTLAAGGGLRFHPELGAVEGFSNPLWTLILAALQAVGLGGGRTAGLLGVVLAGATLVVVATRVGGWAGSAVAVATAASPIFAAWSGRGLEGSLSSLLFAVGAGFPGRPAGAVAFGLLGVTRPEGPVWALVPLAWRLVDRTTAWRWSLAAPLPALAWMMFRKSYFGQWLPATALAKVRGDGWAGVERGLDWMAPLPFADPTTVAAFLAGAFVAALLALLAWDRRGGDLPLVLAAGLAGYGVAVGGDWMPDMRFLQPAVPLVWMGAGLLVRARVVLWPLAVLSVVSGSTVAQVVSGRVNRRDDGGLAQARRTIEIRAATDTSPPAAIFALEFTEEGDTLLAPDLGALAWITGQPILDPQGLTWWSVATLLHRPAGAAPDEEALLGVRAEVRAADPVAMLLAVQGGSARSAGPVSEAVRGYAGFRKASWLAEDYRRWNTIGGGTTALELWVRREVTAARPVADRVERYRAAIRRAPEFLVLRARLAELLREAGDPGIGDEATASWAGLRPPPPVWYTPPTE